ncbi:MAG: transcriptional repressor [Butyrivibrio sp.]|uniref:Fur family transcriptional regulator n=1 Tax=Butyrivibrio sp. TaxID=28121 RepID=UPI001B23FF97|nr:transcriptional repressor [Butyrivibrio sp.]MBO6242434.1 transcriptional repressor [Butyrivibrio sp.]
MSNKIHAESYDSIIERNWPEGFKKTHQRKDIFTVLFCSEEPMSASEIYDHLNFEGSKEKYAFSTVYRNLLAFEKAGIITKTILSTEDEAVYELKKSNHKHYAICTVCHKKIPIKTCPLHDISKFVSGSLPGFEITGHQLEILGICSECNSKNK